VLPLSLSRQPACGVVSDAADTGAPAEAGAAAYDFASLAPCGVASLAPCGVASLVPYGVASLVPYGVASLVPYGVAYVIPYAWASCARRAAAGPDAIVTSAAAPAVTAAQCRALRVRSARLVALSELSHNKRPVRRIRPTPLWFWAGS
jgi:hypothetical protein